MNWERAGVFISITVVEVCDPRFPPKIFGVVGANATAADKRDEAGKLIK